MRPSKIPVFAVLALAGALLAASPAFAGGRHHHGGPRVTFGFHFGAPFYAAPYHYAPYHYAPYYYAPAPIYYSAPVVVQSPPQVYTERADVAAPAPEAQQYWHYCSSARGYYPYVKECPGGWERVPAAPR